jgi:hypothetical protein
MLRIGGVADHHAAAFTQRISRTAGRAPSDHYSLGTGLQKRPRGGQAQTTGSTNDGDDLSGECGFHDVRIRCTNTSNNLNHIDKKKM